MKDKPIADQLLNTEPFRFFVPEHKVELFEELRDAHCERKCEDLEDAIREAGEGRLKSSEVTALVDAIHLAFMEAFTYHTHRFDPELKEKHERD